MQIATAWNGEWDEWEMTPVFPFVPFVLNLRVLCG